MWANVARKKKKCVDDRVTLAKAEVAEQVTRAKDDEAAGLRQELLDTKRALEVEKQAREMLAADMKRSFMRGVCALNMEAMQVRPPAGSGSAVAASELRDTCLACFNS